MESNLKEKEDNDNGETHRRFCGGDEKKGKTLRRPLRLGRKRGLGDRANRLDVGDDGRVVRLSFRFPGIICRFVTCLRSILTGHRAESPRPVEPSPVA